MIRNDSHAVYTILTGMQAFHESRSVYEISSAQGTHDMFIQVFD